MRINERTPHKSVKLDKNDYQMNFNFASLTPLEMCSPHSAVIFVPNLILMKARFDLICHFSIVKDSAATARILGGSESFFFDKVLRYVFIFTMDIPKWS